MRELFCVADDSREKHLKPGETTHPKNYNTEILSNDLDSQFVARWFFEKILSKGNPRD